MSRPRGNTEAELSEQSVLGNSISIFNFLHFRDLAAAIDRTEKYQFDEMIYVVSKLVHKFLS